MSECISIQSRDDTSLLVGSADPINMLQFSKKNRNTTGYSKNKFSKNCFISLKTLNNSFMVFNLGKSMIWRKSFFGNEIHKEFIV